MGDDEDGASRTLDEGLQPLYGAQIEVVGRLVEEDEVRLLHKQAGQGDAALLATRERAHGTLPVFGREPTVALDGGADGLKLFRRLLNIAPDWLAPNALILLEIEATLGIQVLNLACDMFDQAEIHLHQDLTGRDRLLEIRL